MGQFWEAFKTSIIVQSVVTGSMVITYCYMVAAEKPVPNEFIQLLGLIIGFWFGAVVTYRGVTSAPPVPPSEK